MVRCSRDNDTAKLDQLLPPIHRAEGDEVVFPGEQENKQGEGGKVLLRCAPVSDDIHASPEAGALYWTASR